MINAGSEFSRAYSDTGPQKSHYKIEILLTPTMIRLIEAVHPIQI